MGDNVIDGAQVVFELSGSEGDHQAGGSEGLIILNSVTLTFERPTNGYSGLGNEAEVAVGYGPRSASMSHEQMVNQDAAEMLEDLWQNDRTPAEVSVVAGDVLDTRASKMDWNNLEVNYEDDGDATISIDAKLRGVEIEANP